MKNLLLISLLTATSWSLVGFSFIKDNKIQTENRDIPQCQGDYYKRFPTVCYQKLIAMRLGIGELNKTLSIQPFIKDSIKILNSNIEKVEADLNSLQGIRADDANFRAIVTSSDIFEDAKSLKRSYDKINEDINRINKKINEINALKENAKMLDQSYGPIDPKFRETLSETLAVYYMQFMVDAEKFSTDTTTPMKEAEELFSRYNALVDLYNQKHDTQQEKIKSFALNLGLKGYEADFNKLLKGASTAQETVDFLVQGPSEPQHYYHFDPLLEKQGKSVGYSSRTSPIKVYVEYKSIPRDTRTLQYKYFKVVKIEEFNNATGGIGYSVFLEYIPLEASY